MSRLEALNTSPLFRHVPEEAIKEASQMVIERHFAPGDVLLAQDAQGESLHLLVSGTVRVTRVSLGSRERVMGDVYAPGVIGETAVLAEHSERSATVTAVNDVTTLMLHREHFKQLLKRYPDVLWNLSGLLVERVTALNDELIAFGQNTESALSHVFTQLYRQRRAAGVPQPHVLPMGTNDIMQRISSSRETVARVMRKLEKQGLLKHTPHQVTLLDVQRLETATLDDHEPAD